MKGLDKINAPFIKSFIASHPLYKNKGGGVYTYDEERDRPVFVPAPSLKDEDVKTIVETTAHRVIRLLARRGILDEEQLDPLAEESPILAGVTAASVRGMIATGERAGMRVRRVLSDPAEGVRTGYLCYASRGFSLHAATTVESSCIWEPFPIFAI